MPLNLLAVGTSLRPGSEMESDLGLLQKNEFRTSGSAGMSALSGDVRDWTSGLRSAVAVGRRVDLLGTRHRPRAKFLPNFMG